MNTNNNDGDNNNNNNKNILKEIILSGIQDNNTDCIFSSICNSLKLYMHHNQRHQKLQHIFDTIASTYQVLSFGRNKHFVDAIYRSCSAMSIGFVSNSYTNAVNHLEEGMQCSITISRTFPYFRTTYKLDIGSYVCLMLSLLLDKTLLSSITLRSEIPSTYLKMIRMCGMSKLFFKELKNLRRLNSKFHEIKSKAFALENTETINNSGSSNSTSTVKPNDTFTTVDLFSAIIRRMEDRSESFEKGVYIHLNPSVYESIMSILYSTAPESSTIFSLTTASYRIKCRIFMIAVFYFFENIGDKMSSGSTQDSHDLKLSIMTLWYLIIELAFHRQILFQISHVEGVLRNLMPSSEYEIMRINECINNKSYYSTSTTTTGGDDDPTRSVYMTMNYNIHMMICDVISRYKVLLYNSNRDHEQMNNIDAFYQSYLQDISSAISRAVYVETLSAHCDVESCNYEPCTTHDLVLYKIHEIINEIVPSTCSQWNTDVDKKNMARAMSWEIRRLSKVCFAAENLGSLPYIYHDIDANASSTIVPYPSTHWYACRNMQDSKTRRGVIYTVEESMLKMADNSETVGNHKLDRTLKLEDVNRKIMSRDPNTYFGVFKSKLIPPSMCGIKDKIGSYWSLNDANLNNRDIISSGIVGMPVSSVSLITTNTYQIIKDVKEFLMTSLPDTDFVTKISVYSNYEWLEKMNTFMCTTPAAAAASVNTFEEDDSPESSGFTSNNPQMTNQYNPDSSSQTVQYLEPTYNKIWDKYLYEINSRVLRNIGEWVKGDICSEVICLLGSFQPISIKIIRDAMVQECDWWDTVVGRLWLNVYNIPGDEQKCLVVTTRDTLDSMRMYCYSKLSSRSRSDLTISYMNFEEIMLDINSHGLSLVNTDKIQMHKSMLEKCITSINCNRLSLENACNIVRKSYIMSNGSTYGMGFAMVYKLISVLQNDSRDFISSHLDRKSWMTSLAVSTMISWLNPFTDASTFLISPDEDNDKHKIYLIIPEIIKQMVSAVRVESKWTNAALFDGSISSEIFLTSIQAMLSFGKTDTTCIRVSMILRVRMIIDMIKDIKNNSSSSSSSSQDPDLERSRKHIKLDNIKQENRHNNNNNNNNNSNPQFIFQDSFKQPHEVIQLLTAKEIDMMYEFIMDTNANFTLFTLIEYCMSYGVEVIKDSRNNNAKKYSISIKGIFIKELTKKKMGVSENDILITIYSMLANEERIPNIIKLYIFLSVYMRYNDHIPLKMKEHPIAYMYRAQRASIQYNEDLIGFRQSNKNTSNQQQQQQQQQQQETEQLRETRKRSVSTIYEQDNNDTFNEHSTSSNDIGNEMDLILFLMYLENPGLAYLSNSKLATSIKHSVIGTCEQLISEKIGCDRNNKHKIWIESSVEDFIDTIPLFSNSKNESMTLGSVIPIVPCNKQKERIDSVGYLTECDSIIASLSSTL